LLVATARNQTFASQPSHVFAMVGDQVGAPPSTQGARFMRLTQPGSKNAAIAWML